MKKFTELNEFQLRESLLITMQLKLKLNTFLSKLRKLLSNMNQLKELGKEFNTCQLKPKLFTTQREKNMYQLEEDIFKQVTQLEAPFTKPTPTQFHHIKHTKQCKQYPQPQHTRLFRQFQQPQHTRLYKQSPQPQLIKQPHHKLRQHTLNKIPPLNIWVGNQSVDSLSELDNIAEQN